MKFNQLLETANIKSNDKDMLSSFYTELASSNLPTYKKLLVYGCSGFGKTKLIKSLISKARVPIIYYGFEPEKGYTPCKNTLELLKKVKESKECIIFIDNIEVIMANQQDSSCGNMDVQDQKYLFEIFHLVETSSNKILIFSTVAKYALHSCLIDRIDFCIKMAPPLNKAKLNFIKKNHLCKLSKNFMVVLCDKTRGYSYRDIDSLIKLLNPIKQSLSLQDINDIVLKFIPSELSKYTLSYEKDLTLKNMSSSKNIQETLRKSVLLIKQKILVQKLGININNFLFFYGEPGTGKTYAARAFAGETGMPIVTINSSNISSRMSSPSELLGHIIELGTRYENMIFLFDEAEKIFGRNTMGEDAELQGDLQSYLDGVGNKVKSTIIFTLNNEARFGEALKDRFVMVKFELPDLKEKVKFLKSKCASAKEHFSLSFNIESLAKIMGKVSYRVLGRIWDHTLLRNISLNKKSLSIEDFKETIKSFKIKKVNMLTG
ncbi:MAG: ATP-binding protein [Nanoarchaeota archaeon]|nr:ATP-binding protein [Nanoarchaeota archaeon]MCG2719701.1 ATP-binding protein [Nanoarchaeota archaeon]